MNKDNKMIIYMSGAITGLKMEEVKKVFELTKKYIENLYKDKDIEVISPLDDGLEWEDPWHEHMIECLKMISKCTHMFQIPNWIKSVGATIEDMWIDKCNIKRVEYDVEDYNNFISSNL